MKAITVPVLLVGFNRPHCIRKVMQRLSVVKPQKLYITIDAPRDGNHDDVRLVKEVKSIVSNITWDCKAHYNFHEKNVGAEINVSSGISWVLQNEEMVIINEDDIYAQYSFYRFIQDMLQVYKDDETIAMVSGINHSVIPFSQNNNYYFTRMGHIWGWGTWKRVWEKYDLNEQADPKILSLEYMKKVCANEKIAKANLQAFQYWLRPENRTWDFVFSYFRLKNNMLSIVPTRNLVSNIGVDGLHTNMISLCHFYNVDEKFRVSLKKKQITWNRYYDLYHSFVYLHPCKAIAFYHRVKLYLLKKIKFRSSFFEKFYNN